MKARTTREQKAYLTDIHRNPGMPRAHYINSRDSDAHRQQGYATFTIMLRKGFIRLEGRNVFITDKGWQACTGRYY